MTSYGVKPNRIEAPCLINVDRKMCVWQHGDLMMFNINGSGVTLHKHDALKLFNEVRKWQDGSSGEQPR